VFPKNEKIFHKFVTSCEFRLP